MWISLQRALEFGLRFAPIFRGKRSFTEHLVNTIGIGSHGEQPLIVLLREFSRDDGMIVEGVDIPGISCQYTSQLLEGWQEFALSKLRTGQQHAQWSRFGIGAKLLFGEFSGFRIVTPIERLGCFFQRQGLRRRLST